MGVARPSGTVTFVFTDIEGSTQLWERDTDRMTAVVARHDELMADVLSGHGGYVFASGGDGFAVAFGRPDAALAAAIELQERVASEAWPGGSSLRIRVGVHSGAAEERDGNYFGSAVNRAARIGAIANGGHVVVSSTTAALLIDSAVDLVDLGEHSLSGLQRREHLFAIAGTPGWAAHAPLRVTARAGNLPRERVPLVGRISEVAEVRRLVRPAAVVTVVGVGGVGKTRLAIATAAAEAARFSDGCWLVELGQVVAPGDVPAAVAQALDLHLASGQEWAIAAALEGQHRLVVLDNCEHVLDAVTDLVNALLERCPTIALLVTSREALGVDGEHLVPLRPMSLSTATARSEAAELFVDRADAVLGHYEPTDEEGLEIEELCRRLDGLPLAIELAAGAVADDDARRVVGELGRSASSVDSPPRCRCSPSEPACGDRLVLRLVDPRGAALVRAAVGVRR